MNVEYKEENVVLTMSLKQASILRKVVEDVVSFSEERKDLLYSLYAYLKNPVTNYEDLLTKPKRPFEVCDSCGQDL